MTLRMSVTEAREKFTRIPNEISNENVVKVVKRDEPVLAILPWLLYESIIETLDIMGDEELMNQLRVSVEEIRSGKGIPWEEAEKELFE